MAGGFTLLGGLAQICSCEIYAQYKRENAFRRDLRTTKGICMSTIHIIASVGGGINATYNVSHYWCKGSLSCVASVGAEVRHFVSTSLTNACHCRFSLNSAKSILASFVK